MHRRVFCIYDYLQWAIVMAWHPPTCIGQTCRGSYYRWCPFTGSHVRGKIARVRRFVGVLENQSAVDRQWGVHTSSAFSGRPGTDQASPPLRSLRDLDGSGFWCLLLFQIARLYEGSNIASANLEAQTWLIDFRAAATLDYFSPFFPYFWGV